MRALQFSKYGPASVLEVTEVPEPHAGPGQIRVAVRASGVTPADCRFTVPVAAVFPLEEAASAHELSELRHARGKIVLTP